MKNLERKTQELASTYLATLEHPESFADVHLIDLSALGKLFGMHTLVYSLKEDGDVELVHRPTDIQRARPPSDFNLCNAHCSYVKHLAKYRRCFTSQRCDASFPKANHLQRHERSCESRVKRVYSGGVYHPSQTIFEKIEEEGMAFPQELKYSRYQATFEIVVYYPANGTNFPEKQDKLEYTAEHQLLSISVASNVPGYEEPQCFVAEEGREAALQTVAAFVKHLEIIAEQASGLERQRFASLLSRLEKSWDLSYQPPPPLPSPASVFEQEESGESASFDEDSDDDEESEEDDDNEETEEDRSFIDEDDLEEENDLSFYRRVHLQLPERRPVALPAAPAQAMSRLLKKGNDC